MRQTEISELERLAAQPQLVASIPYNNPNREEQVFYDFVRQYGELMGISISEKEVGYWEQIKDIFDSFISSFTKSNMDIIERISNGAVMGLWLLLHPIHYPILGGAPEYLRYGDNTIEICAPKYKGLKNLDQRTHAYWHAYHKICAEDLRQMSLSQIDGFNGIGRLEPPLYVPNPEDLKNYERKILRRMIKKEKK